MRVWNVKGWFFDAEAKSPSEHNLAVGAYTLDTAIDLAVENWNRFRKIPKVSRKDVYGVIINHRKTPPFMSGDIRRTFPLYNYII